MTQEQLNKLKAMAKDVTTISGGYHNRITDLFIISYAVPSLIAEIERLRDAMDAVRRDLVRTIRVYEGDQDLDLFSIVERIDATRAALTERTDG